jgi:hypothetical protein
MCAVNSCVEKVRNRTLNSPSEIWTTTAAPERYSRRSHRPRCARLTSERGDDVVIMQVTISVAPARHCEFKLQFQG